MEKNLNNEEVFNDGKYRVVNVKGENFDHRKVVCNTDSICIIPFITVDNNIGNVYLTKVSDYVSGDSFNSCIVNDTKYNNDSEFSEVTSIIADKLGVTDINVEDLFFIGKVKHNMPFYKGYRCYGMNLDNYTDQLNSINLEEKGLEKVKFNTVVNSGQLHDSLCLSASLLLLSYLR